jgi:putative hydrolase of the HAD superfamily
MRPKAVLFDLDNTLADRSAAIRRVGESLWRAEPAAQARDTLEDAVGLFVKWDGNGRVLPKRLIFEAAEKRWGTLTRTPVELEAWYTAEYPRSYRPDPRIDTMLAALAQRNIPWGIVTNGPQFQWDKVRHLGLDKFTRSIVVSGTFGHRKPEPEIFLEGLRLVGLSDPAECLFVGDSADHDIEGARRVGMATAWVSLGKDWPSTLAPPDHVVGHASEITRLFD